MLWARVVRVALRIVAAPAVAPHDPSRPRRSDLGTAGATPAFVGRRLAFSARRYTLLVVIKSTRGRETARVFARERSPRLPADIQQLAYRKLRMLNNAQSLADLRLQPGNRLEKLSGERAGQHSIRINLRWRICFVWRDGDAHDVEIVDYH